MGYRIQLAATRNDWLNLFAEIEGGGLRFYPGSAASLAELASVAVQDVPMGTAQTGILTLEPFYLAVPVDKAVVPRKIELRRGGVRYAIDQQNNTDSFIFRPGGLWSEVFIVGEISSLYSMGICADVARNIQKQLRRKAYENRGICRIGPECQRLYSGLTFTKDCRNP